MRIPKAVLLGHSLLDITHIIAIPLIVTVFNFFYQAVPIHQWRMRAWMADRVGPIKPLAWADEDAEGLRSGILRLPTAASGTTLHAASVSACAVRTQQWIASIAKNAVASTLDMAASMSVLTVTNGPWPVERCRPPGANCSFSSARPACDRKANWSKRRVRRQSAARCMVNRGPNGRDSAWTKRKSREEVFKTELPNQAMFML